MLLYKYFFLRSFIYICTYVCFPFLGRGLLFNKHLKKYLTFCPLS